MFEEHMGQLRLNGGGKFTVTSRIADLALEKFAYTVAIDQFERCTPWQTIQAFIEAASLCGFTAGRKAYN